MTVNFNGSRLNTEIKDFENNMKYQSEHFIKYLIDLGFQFSRRNSNQVEEAKRGDFKLDMTEVEKSLTYVLNNTYNITTNMVDFLINKMEEFKLHDKMKKEPILLMISKTGSFAQIERALRFVDNKEINKMYDNVTMRAVHSPLLVYIAERKTNYNKDSQDREGFDSLLKAMIAKGADLSVQNSSGNDAFQYFCGRDYEVYAEVIMRNGLKVSNQRAQAIRTYTKKHLRNLKLI